MRIGVHNRNIVGMQLYNLYFYLLWVEGEGKGSILSSDLQGHSLTLH